MADAVGSIAGQFADAQRANGAQPLPLADALPDQDELGPVVLIIVVEPEPGIDHVAVDPDADHWLLLHVGPHAARDAAARTVQTGNDHRSSRLQHVAQRQRR